MLRLHLLNSVIGIQVRDDGLLQLLRLLWQPFLTDSKREATRIFSLYKEEGGWRLGSEEDPAGFVHQDVWQLVDSHRYQMLEALEAHIRGYVTLHAAAVQRGAIVLLLPGESGAGKTTLTLSLVENDWSYLSDDLAVLEIELGLIVPFPKPLSVKDPSCWEKHQHCFVDVPELPAPLGPFLLPPTCFRLGEGPAAPTHLVFARFVPGAEARTESITRAKAAVLASGYLRRMNRDTTGTMVRLAEACESHTLLYGKSHEAVNALEALVNRTAVS